MGLLNDVNHDVCLLLDEDILKGDYIGCHPCINTSSIRLKTKDLLKPGLAGKGLNFLKEVVQIAYMPVYAIGGISPDNIKEVLSTDAAGGCMMSGFMEH